MPESIGTIGKTHGVIDNKRPEKKKPIKVIIKFCSEILEIIVSVSDISISDE